MASPNVVFIITDQQRPDSIGCLGYPYAVTPNLDRLAESGVCLTNMYVQSAVSVPSRASILTSQYVHDHGAENNGMWVSDDDTNFVQEFYNAGYHTAAIGKMHSKPVHHPCGFEYRWVAENKNHRSNESYEDDDYEALLRAQGFSRPAVHYQETVPDWFSQLGAAVWPLPDELFPDNVVGARAVDYVENYNFSKPLFLHVGFVGPHDPFDATDNDLERYNPPYIPDPAAYEGELNDKPSEHLNHMKEMESLDGPAAIPFLSASTPEKIKRTRKHYYANILAIDDWVGHICAKLEEKGQLNNTLIVFTSDHGDPLGDHQVIYKFCNHYESVVKAPCILAGPSVPSREPEPGLAESIDLGPTLLDLCDIEYKQSFGGCSLRRLIQSGDSVHDEVFSEYGQRFMIRRGDWKMVYYAKDKEGELYNLAEDPDELCNRYNEEALSAIKADLLEALLTWRTGKRG